MSVLTGESSTEQQRLQGSPEVIKLCLLWTQKSKSRGSKPAGPPHCQVTHREWCHTLGRILRLLGYPWRVSRTPLSVSPMKEGSCKEEILLSSIPKCKFCTPPVRRTEQCFSLDSPQRVLGVFDVERLSGAQKLQLESKREHIVTVGKFGICQM